MKAATIAILITAALAQSVNVNAQQLQQCRDPDASYCINYVIDGQADASFCSHNLHTRGCLHLCGGCPESSPGIFRSGPNIDIRSATGGTIRLNGQDLSTAVAEVSGTIGAVTSAVTLQTESMAAIEAMLATQSTAVAVQVSGIISNNDQIYGAISAVSVAADEHIVSRMQQNSIHNSRMQTSLQSQIWSSHVLQSQMSAQMGDTQRQNSGMQEQINSFLTHYSTMQGLVQSQITSSQVSFVHMMQSGMSAQMDYTQRQDSRMQEQIYSLVGQMSTIVAQGDDIDEGGDDVGGGGDSGGDDFGGGGDSSGDDFGGGGDSGGDGDDL